MQRQHKVLFLTLGAALVLAAVVWAAFREREPSYKGRTLSEWADLSQHGNVEASDAIRHMGTNTFPIVLKWLRYKPAPWKEKMLGRLAKARGWLPIPDFVLKRLNEPSPLERAGRVLAVLEEKAAPMAPELLRLSYDKSDFHAIKALLGLASMKVAGLPYLTAAVRDLKHPHRLEAAWAMRSVLVNDPSRTNTIQVLTESVADPDVRVQEAASILLSPWRLQKAEGTTTEVFNRREGITNEVFVSAPGGPETKTTNDVTRASPH